MKCEFCKNENGISDTFTKYTEFSIRMYGNEISISDDYGHDDEWKVNFCPMCGATVNKDYKARR